MNYTSYQHLPWEEALRGLGPCLRGWGVPERAVWDILDSFRFQRNNQRADAKYLMLRSADYDDLLPRRTKFDIYTHTHHRVDTNIGWTIVWCYCETYGIGEVYWFDFPEDAYVRFDPHRSYTDPDIPEIVAIQYAAIAAEKME